ncbi:MAG: hypothetical protein ACOVQE_07440 [Chitinophagaceae bacterium]
MNFKINNNSQLTNTISSLLNVSTAPDNQANNTKQLCAADVWQLQKNRKVRSVRRSIA